MLQPLKEILSKYYDGNISKFAFALSTKEHITHVSTVRRWLIERSKISKINLNRIIALHPEYHWLDFRPDLQD